MNAEQVRALLADACATLRESKDELRRLDAAIGDGDLGITVASGASAVIDVVQASPAPRTQREIVLACARSFGSANPSTFSTLVAVGLLAAAQALADVEQLDRRAAVALMDAAISRIGERGGAVLGDKTVLDALIPARDALAEAGDRDDAVALDAMIAAAAGGVNTTAQSVSRRGRAAWVGERSVGQPDGGATAVLRFLQALRRSWPVSAPGPEVGSRSGDDAPARR